MEFSEACQRALLDRCYFICVAVLVRLATRQMGQSRRAFFKFLSLRSTVLSLSHQVRAMMNGCLSDRTLAADARPTFMLA